MYKKTKEQRAGDYENLLFFLKKTRRSFHITKTETSEFIQLGKIRYYKDRGGDDIPKKEMFIFQMIQKDAEKYLQENTHLLGKNIWSPIVFNNCDPIRMHRKIEEKGVFIDANVVEIDLTYAYAEFAKRIGIISIKTFERLILLSKPTRLAAIGSIATVKRMDIYEGGKYIKTTDPEPRPTRPLFFLIAQQVSNLMLELTEQYEQIYFCWVDALFMPAGNYHKVTNELLCKCLKFKEKRELTMTIENADGGNLKYTIRGKQAEERIFVFSKFNSPHVFNHVQGRERDLMDFINENKNDPKTLKEKFTSRIIDTYGTADISKINMAKICRALENTGLDYKNFLKIKKEIETSEHRYDPSVMDFISLVVLTEHIEAIKELKDVKNESVESDWVEKTEEGYWTKEVQQYKYTLEQ